MPPVSIRLLPGGTLVEAIQVVGEVRRAIDEMISQAFHNLIGKPDVSQAQTSPHLEETGERQRIATARLRQAFA